MMLYLAMLTMGKNYSKQIENIPYDMGKMGSYNLVQELIRNKKILLPKQKRIYPHKNSIKWHRDNILYK